MKSLEDRYEEAKEDPVKVKRAFTAIWVASYAMLILGAFIIVGVLIYERLLRTKKQGPSGPIFPLYQTLHFVYLRTLAHPWTDGSGSRLCWRSP